MREQYLVNRFYKSFNEDDDSMTIENHLNLGWKEYLKNLESNDIEHSEMNTIIENIKKILNQYEIIFNGTQDALFLVQMLDDGSFKYIKNNNAYLENFKMKREDMINKTPFEIFGDDLGKRFSKHYKDCILNKTVMVFEEEIKLPTGRKVLLIKLTPILYEEDGKFVVGSSIDITDRKELEMKLDRMANYDKLTNIPNRRLFFKEINRVLEKSKIKENNFAVLFIDLDSFKEVNDTHGHEAGDRVLVETTKRIEECIKENDVLARLGGDEFALIIEDLDDEDEAIKITNKIQERVREKIEYDNKYNCKIDSSIGITVYPIDGNDVQTLMKNADIAMYRVKKKGKGSFKFFSDLDAYKFNKKDGHVHTSYCPHGTDDEMESYIIEGIECELNEISFTEHLPFPRDFEDPSPLKDSAMEHSDLKLYLDEGQGLKLKYSNKIQVNIGVEVDYIEGYEKQIKDGLNQCGPFLDDGILSVHIIKGSGENYYCIDFSSEEFQKIIDDLGSLEAVYNKYYDTLILALNSDLGEYKPKRIGHLNLIRKFNKKFPYDYKKFLHKIEKIMDLVKENGYELDFNVAGLRKEDCGEFYIDKELFKLAKNKGINMVLGSDSHSSKYIKTIKEFL